MLRATSNMDYNRIFLIGYMGSGKSTTAHKLANKLRLHQLDLDEEIERETGVSIASYFNTHGEAAFRLKEREVLLRLVHSVGSFVMATGGGTPCYFDNMEVLKKNGLTIYLQANTKTLVQRLLPQRAKRPLIANKNEADLENFISQQLEEREQYYMQAHIIHSALSIDIEELAARISHYSK